MEKVSDWRLTPETLCIGFLAGNFDRDFLTTLGLLLRCLGGIFSAKMSIERASVRVEYPENQELPASL